MVKQISVFLQNESGRISSIVGALARCGVDIRALSIADTTDFGILRMLVSDVEAAKDCLSKENCIIKVNDVIIVSVPDEPGGLYRVLDLMTGAGIDIEYMYSLVHRGTEAANMVFRVSDEARLAELLRREGLAVVTAAQLGLR